MRQKTRNVGRNPLLYPDEKSKEEIKQIDSDKMLADGFVSLNFHAIISGLPPYSLDRGTYGGAHVYFSLKGIVIYSYRCSGFILKTPISFRKKQLNLDHPAFFICPWSSVAKNKSEYQRLTFLNRRNVLSFKRSMTAFRSDVEKAALLAMNGLYTPMSSEDAAMDAKAVNGIYTGDYVYIRKHDHSGHFYYEKWLELKIFARFVKISSGNK